MKKEAAYFNNFNGGELLRIVDNPCTKSEEMNL